MFGHGLLHRPPELLDHLSELGVDPNAPVPEPSRFGAIGNAVSKRTPHRQDDERPVRKELPEAGPHFADERVDRNPFPALGWLCRLEPLVQRCDLASCLFWLVMASKDLRLPVLIDNSILLSPSVEDLVIPPGPL